MAHFSKNRLYPCMVFDSSFCDDTKWNERDDLVVPGGRAIMDVFYQYLINRGYQLAKPEQHEYYAWLLTVQCEKIKMECYLQDLKPWVLLFEPGGGMFTSINKKRKIAYDVAQEFTSLMQSDSRFYNVQLLTRKQLKFKGEFDNKIEYFALLQRIKCNFKLFPTQQRYEKHVGQCQAVLEKQKSSKESFDPCINESQFACMFIDAWTGQVLISDASCRYNVKIHSSADSYILFDSESDAIAFARQMVNDSHTESIKGVIYNSSREVVTIIEEQDYAP